MSDLRNCSENLSAKFDETQHKGLNTLNDLLKEPFEKHIASFEIPHSLKDIFDVDMVNAGISWYLKWKLTEPIQTQNTCTIKNLFGYEDGNKLIIIINLYKYLRNLGYDPQVIEKIIK